MQFSTEHAAIELAIPRLVKLFEDAHELKRTSGNNIELEARIGHSIKSECGLTHFSSGVSRDVFDCITERLKSYPAMVYSNEKTRDVYVKQENGKTFRYTSNMTSDIYQPTIAICKKFVRSKTIDMVSFIEGIDAVRFSLCEEAAIEVMPTVEIYNSMRVKDRHVYCYNNAWNFDPTHVWSSEASASFPKKVAA